MKDEISGPVTDMLEFSGSPLTLVSHEPQYDDSGAVKRDPNHGTVLWQDPQHVDVTGEVVMGASQRFDSIPAGIDAEFDAEIYIPESYSQYVTSGDESAATRATRIDDGDERFVVMYVRNQQNGTVVAFCELED